jgi:hypothetical protein
MTRAELWMALQPVATPLGEIVAAFAEVFAGGGVGDEDCAMEKAESSTSDTTTRRILGMKVRGLR